MKVRVKTIYPYTYKVQIKFFLLWITIATFRGEGGFSNCMALNSAMKLESEINTNQ